MQESHGCSALVEAATIEWLGERCDIVAVRAESPLVIAGAAVRSVWTATPAFLGLFPSFVSWARTWLDMPASVTPKIDLVVSLTALGLAPAESHGVAQHRHRSFVNHSYRNCQQRYLQFLPVRTCNKAPPSCLLVSHLQQQHLPRDDSRRLEINDQ